MSMKFSVIIPIHNEEENIPELYSRLVSVLEHVCTVEGYSTEEFEIIMVDDGSTDTSWLLLQEFHEKDRRIKGIRFSRNFGHHIALSAGIDHAHGDSVILMDGDLQDIPEEIPKMYDELKKGYDLVYGIREQRHDSIMKKVSSYLFWWFLRRLAHMDIPPGQTMLRIMSRRMVNILKEMREHARFIHGMMAWTGFSATTVPVKHNPRVKGKTKYTIPRMFKLAFHAVTSFSTVPLRLAIYIGFLSSLLSLIVGLYFIYKKLFLNIPVLGYASIMVSLFFVGGIQLLMLGIFGEYIGRTYQEVQKRPLYITKDMLR